MITSPAVQPHVKAVVDAISDDPELVDDISDKVEEADKQDENSEELNGQKTAEDL